MCIRNSINKTCSKNGKDLSDGAPKIKLWNYTQKTHFPVFAKNFRRPWMKLKFFFANFQILGPLGCQGRVAIPQNVKKRQNHCTLLYSLRGKRFRNIWGYGQLFCHEEIMSHIWLFPNLYILFDSALTEITKNVFYIFLRLIINY